MTNQLEPQPMTPGQIWDLVNRVRVAMRSVRSQTYRLATEGARRARIVKGPPRGRLAAQYAHDRDLPIPDAARLYGVARTTVWSFWTAMYGSKKPADWRRRLS